MQEIKGLVSGNRCVLPPTHLFYHECNKIIEQQENNKVQDISIGSTMNIKYLTIRYKHVFVE